MKHILTLAALVLATSCFGQEACPNVHDINSNGTIDIEDFLSILGLFADVDVDEDGVWDSQDDCLDATACNYLASPTEPCAFLDAIGECGGACEGDGDEDGICDNLDTCDGELDECGICNGPGPSQVVVEDIVFTYDSIYLPVENEWFVFAVDADTTFNFLCFPACGDPVNYQGYDYETVLIGEQCWFAENLRSQFYENGDAIPGNLSDYEWDETAWYFPTPGAVAVYGQASATCYENSPDGDGCDESWSLIEYGRLYNWYAVNDERGLCPSGWHVPSDTEWMTLEMALGMSYSEASDSGWRGTDEGSKLKSIFGWQGGLENSNSSGFSGKPGGYRPDGGSGYDEAGLGGFWWSSSPSSWDESWCRKLQYAQNGVLRYDVTKAFGFSIRCIQDSE